MTDAHDPSSPFHAGERHWQAAIGQRDAVEAMGRRMIRDHMPEQHQAFFALLPAVVIGLLDEQGHPWATALCGPPGFAWAPDAHTLQLGAHLSEGDPAASGWRDGVQAGLLGLQHHTRRRNRLNGTLMLDGTGMATIGVRQSFGNCPRYIEPRECTFDPLWRAENAPVARAWQAGELAPVAREVIRRSDTFFIASSSPAATSEDLATLANSEGLDVSHRGGPTGFVQVAQDQQGQATLSWPDFPGNRMFNTLGNIQVQPRVGLLFLDVPTGGWLWLQGQARIATSGHGEEAQRRVEVRITQAWWRPGGPLRWRAHEAGDAGEAV